MGYWDTSALVKLYVQEPDSLQFLTRLALAPSLWTSELSRWELFRVFARKEAEGQLSVGATERFFAKCRSDVAAEKVNIVPFEWRVEEKFQDLILRLQRMHPALFIRTWDGIHLASAELHGTSEFVATDNNARRCASALGFSLYP